MKPEAILLLNPITTHISDIYCCVVKQTGVDPKISFVDYLNLEYSSFIDAVNLVSIGEIENLEKMIYSKYGTRMHHTFLSLAKAKEELKEYDLYYYDMTCKKYTWVKV